tara:strand:- start:266 stop:1366 length:1101 start_codon:yes stop_codon:yes gene_type:complete
MSEDDRNQSAGRGRKFPATSADAFRNKVVSISGLRKFSHKEANDLVSRSVLKHWPQYRIDYYKEVLLRYSERNSVSPQTLYDQIMEPEIAANIRDNQARHGVTLSVAEARPNQGDNGRDLIRKWLHNPDGKIAHGFLKYVRRFLIFNEAELREFMSASQSVLERRQEYHSMSLHDISQADLFRASLRELVKPNKVYYFLLEQEKSAFASSNRKLLALQFHESGIGYFLIYALPREFGGSDFNVNFSAECEGLGLEYQGYLWAPQQKVQNPGNEIELHVVFARRFTKTTSMPPCHPYLLSRQIDLRLLYDVEPIAGSQIAVSRSFLAGGKLTITGELLPEMYRFRIVEISPDQSQALKKLEGIQINV